MHHMNHFPSSYHILLSMCRPYNSHHWEVMTEVKSASLAMIIKRGQHYGEFRSNG